MRVKASLLYRKALCYTLCFIEMPNLFWGQTIGIHEHSDQIIVPELGDVQCYSPFMDWTMFGPIIERNGLRWNKQDGFYYVWTPDHEWYDPMHEPTFEGNPGVQWRGFAWGRDLLTAAQRCYVMLNYGDVVDVPEELL